MKKISILLVEEGTRVDVDIKEGDSIEEIQQKIQSAIAVGPTKNLSCSTHSNGEESPLTFESAKVGILIENTTEKNNYGIIIAVNTKVITIATKYGIIYDNPNIYKKTDIDIEKAMWTRTKEYQQAKLWSKGDVGFLAIKTKDGVKIERIIITSERKGNFKLHRINDNSYYTMSESKIINQLFDTREEAEKISLEKLGSKEYQQKSVVRLANLKQETKDILNKLTSECTKMKDWCKNNSKFKEDTLWGDWESDMCKVFLHAIVGGEKNIAIRINYKKTKYDEYYTNQKEFENADQATKFILENKLA